MVDVPSKPGAYRFVKSDEVIYVGSAKDLLERYTNWKGNPDQNPCIKSRGWDKFVFQPTSSHKEALDLELAWYNQYNPVCNRVTPPGR